MYISTFDKQQLCSGPVFLDGMPAVVCGFRNEFATVASKSQSVEFSWAAVKYVRDNRLAKFFS